MNNPANSDDIILEIVRIGNLLRVVAFDPETLTEVIFQAPPTTDQATLTALAKRKLAFVAKRTANGSPAARGLSG